MRTFHDIKFDQNYLYSTFQFLLINDNKNNTNRTGPVPVVALPNALIMTFINVFQDLNICRQYISEQNQKVIKLFISNSNLIDWDNVTDKVENNIQDVYVFCDTFFNYLQMKQWKGLYQNKIRDVYLTDQVDYQLLRLGVDYLHSAIPECREDRGLARLFRADAKRLLDALKDYFQDQIDSEDDE